jgi:hypothetical protein
MIYHKKLKLKVLIIILLLLDKMARFISNDFSSLEIVYDYENKKLTQKINITENTHNIIDDIAFIENELKNKKDNVDIIELIKRLKYDLSNKN